MCKAHKTLADERSRLYNRTDIYSQDKKAENSRITAVCIHLRRCTRIHVLDWIFLMTLTIYMKRMYFLLNRQQLHVHYICLLAHPVRLC